MRVPETYQAKKYDQAYKDGINQKRGVDAKRTMRSRTRAVGQEHTVSTRLPTAKEREADPSINLLLINGDIIKNDSRLSEQAANLIKGYNLSGNSKLYVNFSNEEIIEDHIEGKLRDYSNTESITPISCKTCGRLLSYESKLKDDKHRWR